MKRFLTKFLKQMLGGCLLLVLGLNAEATDVSGTIAVNTTWTVANSPYVVTGNITVQAGKILTIEPGVVVNFNINTSAIDVNGRLIAQGTATNPIYFTGGNLNYNDNKARGPITFNATGSNSVMTYVIVDQLGYENAARGVKSTAIVVNSPTCSISNCTIQNTWGSGIDLNVNAKVFNNLFVSSSNTLLDVTVDADRLKANNLKNNGALKIGLTADSGAMVLNDTLKAENSYYELLGNQNISSGKILTIEAGVTVYFDINTSAIDVNGRLIAQGTSTNPIYFTGGNLNYSDDKARGPIRFNATGSNSVMTYVIVDQLGYENAARCVKSTAIVVNSPTCSISNCTIQNTWGSGIDLNVNAKVFNNLFVSSSNTLLDVTVDADRLKANNLKNNGALKIGLTADSGAMVLNDTLKAENSYYELLGNQNISSGKILTIEAGVTVYFDINTSAIDVNGRLIAQGTSTNPIYFTGGNLNYSDDKARGPIRFNATGSNSVMTYVIVDQLGYENAARNNTTAVIIAQSISLSINKCVIQNNQGVGLLTNGNASPNVVGTCFSNNTNGSVRVLSGKPKFYRCNFSSANNIGIINASNNSADTVSARECWWSSPNGPKNATVNPGGTGDSVSAKVSFSPYSTIPFNCPNSDDDLSITSILSPKVSCNLKDTENVTVVIKNNGSSVISGYTVTYQVNNNPIVRESPTALAAGASLTYTFATKANLSYGNGTVYNIRVYTELAADPVNNNDTAWSTITNNKPYVGKDTTFTICSGSSGNITTLYNTTGYSSVLWKGTLRPDSVTAAGKDTLIVTNNFGCKDTVIVTVVIAQGSAITSKVISTNAGCFGGNLGSITVNPTNGKAPYFYKNGSAGIYQPANIFKTLSAGTYTIYIKDSNSCQGNTAPVIIAQYQPITATFTKTDATCFNKADGTITVAATGGKPPYKYKLGTNGIFQDPSTFTGLKAGIYKVYIKDNAGCTGVTGFISINQPPTPCFAKRESDIFNNNESDAALNISLSPNPTNSAFSMVVHSDRLAPFQMRVLDVNGKVVYTAKGQPEQAFRFGGELMSGVYLVEVKQGDVLKTIKAVKVR